MTASELPPGVAETGNLSAALRGHARERPGAPFLVEHKSGRRLNLGEADALVDGAARFLTGDLGLREGAIVSAVLPNSAEYVVLYLAALRSGVVLNPYPFTLSAPDLCRYLEHVRPDRVLCTAAHHADLAAACGHPLVEIGRDFLSGLPDAGAPASTFVPGDRTTACLYYSSGTTGNPKTIAVSHRNMVANIGSIVRGFRFGPGDVHLVVLPLGHTASVNYSLLPCTWTGATVVLAESFWKVRRDFWSLLEEHGVTYVELVPSLVLALLHTPYALVPATGPPAPFLRWIGCGSSTLPRELQTAFQERYGIPVANLYGLSETGPTHLDDPRAPGWEPGSLGFPLDCNECWVADESGRPVPAGEVGEVVVRGDNVFLGYHHNPGETARAIRDGVFFTGDLGRMDEKGRLWFVGRKKELVIKGGVNIAPDEVDEVLHQLDGVERAVTVGVDDALLGERIRSFVVAAPGACLTEQDVIRHCGARLSRDKVPDEVRFVTEIPTGPSGKYLRRVLREMS